jgi:predicted metalloprotease with PDZ domain
MYRFTGLQLRRKGTRGRATHRVLISVSAWVALWVPVTNFAQMSTGPISVANLSQHAGPEPARPQSAQAQAAQPQPAPSQLARQTGIALMPMATAMPSPIAAPRDVPFPGTIRLQVDATDISHRIFQVRETIPVEGGHPVTLLFPKWTTGDHTPNGPLDKLSGIIITAHGQKLRWVRDTVEVYAFHVNVPKGVETLDLEYQYLGSTEPRVGPVLITSTMLDLQWQAVVLYPAGYYSRDIQYEASVILPKDWDFACALDGGARANDRVDFARVSLETLIDSPVMAGRYFKQITLSDNPVPVRLDIVADEPSGLEPTSDVGRDYAKLVSEAHELFGAHHYNHYDLMLWLADDFGPVYYEHHRSGENSGPSDLLKMWGQPRTRRGSMAHGYVHSWNGTFLRPATMWTPNFNTAEIDSMLWVFEGLTMYWQDVLTARSGMSTRQDALASFADLAASTSTDVGMSWRPLEDVNNEPLILFRRPQSWPTWQQNMFDAYSQGEMIWLDADALIRQRTAGRKSLDDFARLFFGQLDGSYATQIYTFEAMVTALNSVLLYDWATFFRSQLEATGPVGRIDGITRSGYGLVYDDKPASPRSSGGPVDLSYSVGMVVGAKGRIANVLWHGPAFEAGLIPGATIVEVNDHPFDGDALQAVAEATGTGIPLRLTVQDGKSKETVTIDWKGGARYPHLQRIPSAPAYLDAILAARAPAGR